MLKATLLFYQFPECNTELENWEKKVKSHKKIIDDKGRIVYTIIDGEEKIFCFDINNFTLKEIEEIFKENFFKYNKTLIFGKVTFLNLFKIQQAITRYEL